MTGCRGLILNAVLPHDHQCLYCCCFSAPVVASVNGIQAIVYLDFLLVLAEFAKSAVEEVTDELDDEDDEDLSDDEEDGPDDSRSTPHRVSYNGYFLRLQCSSPPPPPESVFVVSFPTTTSYIAVRAGP